MAGIHDVARRAGVSPITVSRVVNNQPGVRDETRRRVLDAIAELNYIPNAVARGLKQARSGLLALIITDITSPFFTDVARGAEDAARAAGLSLVLGNSDEDPALEAAYLRTMGEHRVDGIVLVPTVETAAVVARALPQRTTIVLLDRDVPALEADAVLCDTETGTADLTRHLLGLGHRRIAIVGGMPSVDTWHRRVAGYLAALRANGLLPPPDLVIPGDYKGSGGAAAVRRLLDGVGLPDAIIAANAQVAVGVLNELAAAGFSAPADVAVAAVDDPLPGWAFWPRLTVVKQPGYEMGGTAVDLLLARLTGERTDQPAPKVVLPATLVVGTSCGEAGRGVGPQRTDGHSRETTETGARARRR